MKTIKLTALLLVFPLTFYAQSLTGLWAGTLSNDSNTIRKDQSFEIVLTQYKDKVYGYSRMTFFVHDSLYYIVKRVKGTVEGDLCEVKDDGIISHNFPQKPDKGVKLVSTFRRNQQDSVWRLDGDWKTTETRKHGFYSISGKIALKTETDLEKSKLIPHLEELKLTDDVAVYTEAKKAEQESVAAAKHLSERTKTTAPVQKQPVISSQEKEMKKEEVVKAPVKSEPIAAQQIIKEEKKQPAKPEEKTTVVVTNETKKDNNAVTTTAAIKQPVSDNKTEGRTIVPVKTETAATAKPPVTVSKETQKEEVKVAKQDPPQQEKLVTIKPIEQKKDVAITATNTEVKKPTETVAVINEKPQQLTNVTELKIVNPQAATFVTERKIAAPQTVFFKSDSLELALYDNGEVDGDTVSVLLNGDLILAKQGLKTTAIRKTVYVPSGKTDSLTLVLYAENLGKYPPNTGLLVVHDGDDVYQIRFSADLQQNASIVFKRKRN